MSGTPYWMAPVSKKSFQSLSQSHTIAEQLDQNKNSMKEITVLIVKMRR
jgi:CDP-diacylglycerol pyrophosphatase